MRRLALAIMVVSAFSLADVTFGFQETDKPKDETAAVAVTARGQIEDVSLCDIRCEVSPTGEGGVLIRKIVPEGTLVKKGQVLVEFDASGMKEEEVRQQIACTVSEAGVIKCASEYEVAVIEKEAFVEGAFKIAKAEAELAIFVLEEALRRAEEELAVVAELAEAGHTPKPELEAAKFAVAKGRKELDLARLRLQVLQKYTFTKTLHRIEGQIKTAHARLKAEEHNHQLDRERLKLISSQIENCTVKAPMAGRAVHLGPGQPRVRPADRRANEKPKLVHGPAGTAIRPGVRVRQGQPILSIQDPAKMRIRVWTLDPKASEVEPGAPATIRVDAFPEMELKGAVAKIAKLPAGRPSASGRKPGHQATITIHDPPDNLRAGLTAEVTIDAEKGQ